MKEIHVVSLGHTTGKALKEQVKSIVGNHANVEYSTLTEIKRADLKCDLLVFTSNFGYESAKHFKPEGVNFVISGRVIDHNNLEPVITLPVGTEVLLVNDSIESAYEAIEQLNELGLDHISYYPYYPNCTEFPRLETVITPGEPQIVPDFATNAIDIGTRVMDISTIHNILSKLGLTDTLQDGLTERYIKDIVAISKSIEANRRVARDSEQMLSIILDTVETGIGFLNSSLEIQRFNKKLGIILNNEQQDILKKDASLIITDLGRALKEDNGCITTLGGVDYLLQIQKIDEVFEKGYLILLEPVDRIFKQDHEAKRSYERQLRTHLYSLKDYLSQNPKVINMLRKVRKFAIADATVLIQGENGTGKEILAQGIHMHSERRDNPFIPINIASITPTLLESELFGYEEGAFTGAKRGGKPGLFEIANSGTLFIDEIGDAPLDIQARLLRVLQEKKVRRVGGDKEFPIDVRIIAATNKDLLDLVDSGGFRRDLFFRLNILPIRTIPLRRRKEDILYLLTHYISQRFDSSTVKLADVLAEESLNLLKHYSWRGNVREVINIVEYIRYIYEDVPLTLDELPDYLLQQETSSEQILLSNHLFELLRWIAEYHGIGRKRLHQLSVKANLDIGEGKIRTMLDQLKGSGLITIGEEARGCVITELGNKTLRRYE